MLAFIDENTILLLGLFLALFAISLGGYRNPVLAEIAGTGVRRSVFHVLKWPGAVLLRAFHNQRWLFLSIHLIFMLFFCMGAFLYLQSTQPFYAACLGFLPLALLGMHALYYLLWLCSYLVYACIDVGNTKFNLLFSLTTIELLLVYVALPAQGAISLSKFSCILINLGLCYFFTAKALHMVLKETLRQTTTFTHHNLWKVALTLCMEFLIELTFFCYAGASYYASAYNVPLTLFDAFYFVTISFGTIGYGDIIPACTYSKAISILITLTSITCIGVMLSSFLSAGPDEQKRHV